MRITVYGANGYQGKLVVTELARRGIEPVLAGRSRERLRAAAETTGVAGADLRTAAVDEPDALAAAFHGSDAVVNCAGPFTPTGAAVVRAAVAAGCHYVDTAGERDHLIGIFDRFAADAERAGVAVLPAATDGGVPGDLIARMVAGSGPVEAIRVAHAVSGGGWSRGSVRSLLGMVATLGADPPHRGSFTFPADTGPTEVVTFPLPEVVTIPRHIRVRHVDSVVAADVTAALTGTLTADVIAGLPDGPDEAVRRGQRFTIVVDATAGGRTVRGVVDGVDPYATTAVIAVEAARRLVADGVRPGVLAPAQALDPGGFLDFLAPHGVRWRVEAGASRPARPVRVRRAAHQP